MFSDMDYGECGLRSWMEDDAPALLEITRRAPELHRQLPRLPEDLADARQLIRECLLSTERAWVWCLTRDLQPVGLVRIETTPESQPREGSGADGTESEGSGTGLGWFSYWSARAVRGTGLLSAAARAVADWALDPSGGGLRRLELGYREDNPGSAAVARRAGLTVEGRERQKFVIDGRPVDVITAGRLAADLPAPDSAPSRWHLPVPAPAGSAPTPSAPSTITGGLHHLELWTGAYAQSIEGWRWLLRALGARPASTWTDGESWDLPGSAAGCVVIEGSSAVRSPEDGADRMRPGMNHVAFRVPDRAALDAVRRQLPCRGWTELFGDQYPHAGGAEHTALYLENTEGFEVELVATAP